MTSIPPKPPASGTLSGDDGATPPPILRENPSTPQYNLATMVEMVGVRAMTLWAWEQQWGIPQPQPEHGGDGSVRLYSERDLVACLWLRDQILLGVPPMQAAERLLNAQPPSDRSQTPLPRMRVNSVPLRHGLETSKLPALETRTGALDHAVAPSPSRPSAPRLPATQTEIPWEPPRQPVVSGPLRPIAPPIRPPVLSGPLRAPAPDGVARPSVNSGPLRAPAPADLARPHPYTIPLNPPPPGALWRPPSAMPVPEPMPGPAPMQSPVSVPQLPPMSPRPPMPQAPQPADLSGKQASQARIVTSGSRWPIPTTTAGRELHELLPQLLRAFVNFDTHGANRLLEEVLAAHSLEIVYSNLLQPALSRIVELGAHRRIGDTETRYAINFIRQLLFSAFDPKQERVDGPVVIVACAPRELDDVGALALATFWRRAGLRVVYIGEDADGPDLVLETRKRRPQLVCVCISSAQRVRALARIARGIMQGESHPPVFTYSGAPFSKNPELQRRVNGVFLGDDPRTATWHVMRLLGADPRSGAFPPPPGTMGTGRVG